MGQEVFKEDLAEYGHSNMSKWHTALHCLLAMRNGSVSDLAADWWGAPCICHYPQLSITAYHCYITRYKSVVEVVHVLLLFWCWP